MQVTAYTGRPKAETDSAPAWMCWSGIIYTDRPCYEHLDIMISTFAHGHAFVDIDTPLVDTSLVFTPMHIPAYGPQFYDMQPFITECPAQLTVRQSTGLGLAGVALVATAPLFATSITVRMIVAGVLSTLFLPSIITFVIFKRAPRVSRCAPRVPSSAYTYALRALHALSA